MRITNLSVWLPLDSIIRKPNECKMTKANGIERGKEAKLLLFRFSHSRCSCIFNGTHLAHVFMAFFDGVLRLLGINPTRRESHFGSFVHVIKNSFSINIS